MNDLIRDIFQKHFSNPVLDQLEDAAALSLPSNQIAFTTDSFVVSPLTFPGGDIGRVAVSGTVNDLLMRGAIPRYLSAGFILQEGLDTHLLEQIVLSMKKAADEARVKIVAGDTKVVEGTGELYINTSGIGMLRANKNISVRNAAKGDAVVVSGYLGNHHACILSCRMGIQNSIESDCAPLVEMVENLLNSEVDIHTMRDITRGGLATVLHEIAAGSGVQIELSGGVPFADNEVQGFSDILGLDPLYMGNEGKLVLFLPEEQADKAVEILRSSKYGESVQIIGKVNATGAPSVRLHTRSGSIRAVEPLLGEGLPRIC